MKTWEFITFYYTQTNTCYSQPVTYDEVIQDLQKENMQNFTGHDLLMLLWLTVTPLFYNNVTWS